jgi:Domain of Unknown Function (DUF1080)
MKTRLTTLAFVAFCAALSAEDKVLFNGKDLTGWEGNTELWSVKDGLLTGQTQADPANPAKSTLSHNTFLVWRDGTVKDFELTFQYKVSKGNSGVQYRSKELPKGAMGPIISGYQADFEAGTTYSGILYEERARGILALRGEKVTIHAGQKEETGKDGQVKKVMNREVTGKVGDSAEIQATIKSEDWNDYKIVANGGHLQHIINGKTTVDVTDNSAEGAKEGVLALQIHAGPPMVVQFKNLVLKELK